MSNSKRRCKQCKEYYLAGDMVKVPAGWFCSHDHAVDFAQNRARIARDKEKRKKLRQDKERIKTRSDWLREAQAAFNKYIRLRDKDLPCISCDKPNNGSHQRHASHYRSVGAHPELRFESLNVHASCAQCNAIKSGNLVEYRIRLSNKIGAINLTWLEGPHEPKKYTVEEIKEIIKEYKEKIKLLE